MSPQPILSRPPTRLPGPTSHQSPAAACRPARRRVASALVLLGAAAVQLGCGGKAIVDLPLAAGGGGAGGTGGMTTTTTTTTTTTGTGGVGGEGGFGGEPGEYQLVEVDLGALAEDELATFEVTPQTLGITTIVYSPNPYGGVGVKRLEAPNEELLIDNHKIPGHHYEFSFYGTTVSGLPQSDSSTVMPVVMPGIWEMTVGDPDTNAGADKVSVWRRESEDGAFHGGYLDINVFIAGDVVSESYATSMLESAFADYAGLQIGEIAFHGIGSQWQTIDENSWMPVLEQTASGSLAPALNVIMIGWFDGQLADAAGISAGIPGQGIEHGTHSSAVTMMAYGDVNMDSLIVRHETGHMAGLFHTSEIAQGMHDPLADTAECSDVEQLLDACPDAFNLMFPYAMYNLDVTPLQKRVIHGSSLYRAELIYAGDPELGDDAEDSPVQGSQTGQGSQATGAAAGLTSGAPRGSWTQGLDPRLTRLLDSHWCGHQWHRSGALPHRRLVNQLAPRTADLWAIGLAADAPSHVRYRALLAAAERASRTAATPTRGHAAVPTKALIQLARNRSTARAPRLGALQALRQLAPTLATGLASELRQDADPAIAHWARR